MHNINIKRQRAEFGTYKSQVLGFEVTVDDTVVAK